ncbi:MAG TPA: GspH/FimT family pseudopilin [Hyphomicrobiaceae bacterium]|jgi:general secretion pathway protein H|nr:GspH/FimT family pseudopilin [Hyphomicrobiaceae bacterium]
MTRRAHPLRPGEDAGFTLLELIVALGIMALAVALVFPYFEASRAGHQLRAAAYDIATQLRDARATAQARNVDQAFILDVGNRRMWLDGSERRRYLSPRMAVDVEVPIAEQLAANVVRVRFFADGSASGGKLVLRDGGRRATVTVNWLTGDVRVE